MIGNPGYMPPVEVISIQEFWRAETNTSSNTTARVGLTWGENSAVSENSGDYAELVVVAYNESNDWWDSFGGQSHAYNNNMSSLQSANPVNFTTRYITLGSM